MSPGSLLGAHAHRHGPASLAHHTLSSRNPGTTEEEQGVAGTGRPRTATGRPPRQPHPVHPAPGDERGGLGKGRQAQSGPEKASGEVGEGHHSTSALIRAMNTLTVCTSSANFFFTLQCSSSHIILVPGCRVEVVWGWVVLSDPGSPLPRIPRPRVPGGGGLEVGRAFRPRVPGGRAREPGRETAPIVNQ